MQANAKIHIYKVLLSLILVAITLNFSSCTDEGMEITQNIRFTRPVLKGIMRANVTDKEINNPYSMSETFRVFGTIYDSDIDIRNVFAMDKEYDINGEEAFYDGMTNTWNTNKQHIWKCKKKYAFRAYSPADIQGAMYKDDASGLKLNEYTTPEIGQQFDLLYAPAVYDRQKYISLDMTDAERYNEVNMVFMHALSAIHFRVRVDPRYIKEFPFEQREALAKSYTVRSIKIEGVYNKASFDEMSTVGKDDKGKTVNIPSSNPEQMWYNHSFDEKKVSSYEFLTPSSPIKGVSFRGEPKDITDMTDGAHIGFMIPQKIPDDAQIRVEWSKRTKDKEDNYVSVFRMKDAEETQKREWKIGRRYIYTLAVWDFRMEIEPAAESIIDDSDIENIE